MNFIQYTYIPISQESEKMRTVYCEMIMEKKCCMFLIIQHLNVRLFLSLKIIISFTWVLISGCECLCVCVCMCDWQRGKNSFKWAWSHLCVCVCLFVLWGVNKELDFLLCVSGCKVLTDIMNRCCMQVCTVGISIMLLYPVCVA